MAVPVQWLPLPCRYGFACADMVPKCPEIRLRALFLGNCISTGRTQCCTRSTQYHTLITDIQGSIVIPIQLRVAMQEDMPPVGQDPGDFDAVPGAQLRRRAGINRHNRLSGYSRPCTPACPEGIPRHVPRFQFRPCLARTSLRGHFLFHRDPAAGAYQSRSHPIETALSAFPQSSAMPLRWATTAWRACACPSASRRMLSMICLDRTVAISHLPPRDWGKGIKLVCTVLHVKVHMCFALGPVPEIRGPTWA